MSEMALTADELIVVGKGGWSPPLPRKSSSTAHRRDLSWSAPLPGGLGHLLLNAGASVAHGQDGRWCDRRRCVAVGGLAADHGIRLQEISNQRASLEAAFLELTRDSLEFQPSEVS
jgi:ABC-2 type transport system ATP-binding protein